MEILFNIRIDNGARYIARANDTLNLKSNDWCVIRKDFFQDYGQIIREIGPMSEDRQKNDYPKIERKATVRDQGKANENKMRAKSALRTAGGKVTQLKLPMKLLNAHYTFDGKLVTIQFTADGRVDFRELVRQLSQSLGTRIELRQIGVRDEAAIHGGIGVCGQALCCCRFLKEFSSINVRMAKCQDLSLNPTTISGMCGRLKCCLRYEYEGYLELDKDMPRRGDLCECAKGRGRVIDRNLMTQEVVVGLESGGKPIRYKKEEVQVVYPEKYKMPSSKGRQGRGENDSGVEDTEDPSIKALED
jgi:cell fate regulator YaaT (PSP1 superfamily)